MSASGRLIIISGFAGTGKGTLVKKLMSEYPDCYALSVSATTRSPRPGEEEGREYFFMTQEAFEGMIERDELLEYAFYVGHYYGTPRRYVEERLAEGRNVLLEIEMQGAFQVRERFPDALLLFVVPPTAEELVGRLHGRGSESEEEIAARLARAVEEADGCGGYDYMIVNDILEDCVERTHRIIRNERFRMRYCREEIETLKHDLMTYVKGEEI